LRRNRSCESLRAAQTEQRRMTALARNLANCVRTDAALGHRREEAERMEAAAFERAQCRTASEPAKPKPKPRRAVRRRSAPKEQVQLFGEEDMAGARGPCCWRQEGQENDRDSSCRSEPEDEPEEAAYPSFPSSRPLSARSGLVAPPPCKMLQALSLALAGRKDMLSLDQPARAWCVLMKAQLIVRMIKRWWRRVKAARAVRWTLRHAPLFFQVRAAYHKRSAAARCVQRGWRFFSSRVDHFVRAVLRGPWQRHEQCFLEALFTACPLDDEVTLGDSSLLCGEAPACPAPTGSRPSLPGKSAGQRPSLPWRHTGSVSGGPAPRPASAGAAGPSRPSGVGRRRSPGVMAERKRQDEELQEMLKESFRRHVKQCVQAHHFLGQVASLLLRREVVERLYEHCSLGFDGARGLKAERYFGSSVRCMVAAAAQVSGHKADDENEILRWSTCGLPPAVIMSLEEVAELVLCAHCRKGARPTRQEVCARLFKGCSNWRLAAVEELLDGTRTIEAGLVDRWSARHRQNPRPIGTPVNSAVSEAATPHSIVGAESLHTLGRCTSPSTGAAMPGLALPFLRRNPTAPGLMCRSPSSVCSTPRAGSKSKSSTHRSASAVDFCMDYCTEQVDARVEGDGQDASADMLSTARFLLCFKARRCSRSCSPSGGSCTVAQTSTAAASLLEEAFRASSQGRSTRRPTSAGTPGAALGGAASVPRPRSRPGSAVAVKAPRPSTAPSGKPPLARPPSAGGRHSLLCPVRDRQ